MSTTSEMEKRVEIKLAGKSRHQEVLQERKCGGKKRNRKWDRGKNNEL